MLLIRPINENRVDGNTCIGWICNQVIHKTHYFDYRDEHDKVRWRPAFESVCIVFPITMMWKHFVGQAFNHSEIVERFENQLNIGALSNNLLF